MKTNSSNVDCVIMHDDDLYVRFHSGKCYQYIGAGQLYYDMIGAESIGSFLNREVKPHYDFALVESDVFDKLETESTPATLLFKFTGGRNCFF